MEIHLDVLRYGINNLRDILVVFYVCRIVIVLIIEYPSSNVDILRWFFRADTPQSSQERSVDVVFLELIEPCISGISIERNQSKLRRSQGELFH